MSLFEIIAILLSLTAVFSYINHRFIGMPTGIGIMLIGLVLSLFLIVLNQMGWFSTELVERHLATIDFDETVMNGMLSFLLFAGALHVNLNRLSEHKETIAILASLGVVMSALMVSVATYYIMAWVGINISYIYCLMFSISAFVGNNCF